MENKYKKLMSNTMLFAISNFSSKLLSIILQPYITFAMGEVDEVGIWASPSWSSRSVRC